MDKTKTVMDDDWFSEPLVAFCGITNAFGPSHKSAGFQHT